ncbi:MAG: GNAT family N-acetyltransferase [Clostridia bacterium]|nr:GNAT family N-acetyltransferase [Clostridia bacterium]
MEQLSMIFRGKSFDLCELPEGYSFDYFSGALGQIDEWLAICREGLIEPGAGPELFKAAILDVRGIDPVKDLVFVRAPSGEAAATITFYTEPGGKGMLHMVCCREKYRGLGIGNAIVSYALAQLTGRGTMQIGLTTDDFRLPAIRAYLRMGFEPVVNSEEMQERWKNVLDKLR